LKLPGSSDLVFGHLKSLSGVLIILAKVVRLGDSERREQRDSKAILVDLNSRLRPPHKLCSGPAGRVLAEVST
jgi:hypothetical protein